MHSGIPSSSVYSCASSTFVNPVLRAHPFTSQLGEGDGVCGLHVVPTSLLRLSFPTPFAYPPLLTMEGPLP